MQHPHPTSFTILGFHLASLLDDGNHLDIEETRRNIKSQRLFKWLKEEYGDGFCLNLLPEKDLNKIEGYFFNLNNVTDAKRKMGISKNGLCLLIAYCFNAAQEKEENINYG